MKTLSVKEIQKVSLDLLIQFDTFCRSHNLSYSLGYGTLIGAVRHSGFIPWDDDIDIMMPRPDFERFCSLYESKPNAALYAPSLSNTFLSYARLCDTISTVVLSPAPWNKDETGVWIDIFPIDGASDNLDLHTKKFMESFHLYDKQIHERFIWKYRTGGIRSRLKYYVYYLMGKGHCISFAKKYDRFCKSIQFGATDHVTGISCPSAKKVIYYNLNDFADYIEIEFENNRFMIASGYDNILVSQYGNYMELPKLEDRIPCHSAHKYYWR